MYHERTQKEIRSARMRVIAIICLVMVLVAVCIVGVMSFRASTRDQSAASIRDSIISTAMQCYAIEGSYPSSFKHLKNTYGLTVNESDYIIHYDWLADNVLPSVAVEAR